MFKQATALCLLLACAAIPALAETRQIEASPGEQLTIELKTGGELTIRGTARTDVQILSELSGRDAALVQLEMKRAGDGVRITSRQTQKKNGARYRLKLTIEVPERFDVRFETMGGNIELDGIEGELIGKTMGGEMQLSNLRGRIDVSTMGGNVNLSDSDVDGEVATMGGNVRMENIVGSVSGKTMGGNVIQHNVQARGGATAETLRMESMGGNLTVTEAPAGAELSTMGGNIQVESVGEFIKAKTMGGSISVGELDGWAELTTMGGSVSARVVEGRAGSRRDVQLISHGGGLTLELPRGFSGEFEVTLIFTKDSKRNYTIETDLPLAIETTVEWSYAGRGPDGVKLDQPFKVITGRGRVGSGTHKVKLRTINGKISIKQY